MRIFFALALTLSSFPAVARPLNLMPFGDSLTAGAYITDNVYHTDSGYRQTLYNLLVQEMQPVRFVGQYQDGNFAENHHEGHSGWRIDQISAGASQWVAAARPDVILLLIGTNDCIQNYDLAHAMNRMEILVQKIRSAAPNAVIFISTTLPHSQPQVQARVLDYNKALTAWVLAKSKTDTLVHFVDMYSQSKLQGSDLIDGVHPTPQGYAAMGMVWYQALQSILFH